MVEVERKTGPSGEEKKEIFSSFTQGVHSLGDFKAHDPEKALALYHELEKDYYTLLDLDPEKRLMGVLNLGSRLSSMDDKLFGVSKVIDGSATYMLASCIKDPDSKVREAAIKQLKNIASNTPVTSIPHVIALNALKTAPKWNTLLSRLPKLPKLF
ncbi:MAG: hypothetical protein KKD39_08635 [Candidatus Altiarchaeota archaeon]|nr:hypothetical protein [Candidatus Altiarchaeota archaeon]